MPALARIEASVQQLPGQVHQIVDASIRSWHGIIQDLGQAAIQAERIVDRPTELLIARYRVVPFFDRAAVLAGLREWATACSGPRAQGRLYVAPRGLWQNPSWNRAAHRAGYPWLACNVPLANQRY